MATLNTPRTAASSWQFIVAILLLSLHHTEAQVGVCYGNKGNNLPCPEEVVDLYEYYNIKAMRIYEPDQRTQQALQGTSITLMLGVHNQDIPGIASRQSTANDWVSTNVVPYAASIKYIAVGNEVRPSHPEASSMAQAMQNIQNALNSNDLGSQIKVSTAVDSSLITNSYPPSHAEFKDLAYITPIINFLKTYDSPLLVNIEPYAAYVNDPKNIALDYALFTACGTVFTDDRTGKNYQNLFDALYDAMYVAILKVSASTEYDLTNSLNNGARRPVTTEALWSSKDEVHHSKLKRNNGGRTTNRYQKNDGCGWPKGGEAATVENAKLFYTNMIKHVKKGTPLTQGLEMEAYLFAMFDENQKPGYESERHSGLFSPDGEPKYGTLDFCSSG